MAGRKQRVRRRKGEGSITQVREGLWQAKATIGGRRRSLYARTEKEVVAKLRTTLANAEKGEPLAGQAGRERLDDYLGRWLETVARPKLRRSTVKTYEGYIRNHLNPRLGRRRLSQLTAEHVDVALADMAAHGLSPASIRQARAILRSALGHAERRGLVVRNVVRLSEPPRVVRRELRVLTEDEARRLVEVASAERLGALWILMLDTGLRRGEALGLRWRDIDLERRYLRVVQARESIGEGFGEPKSKESQRSLAFTTVTAEALAKWREIQEAEGEAVSRWTADDLVFTTPAGAGLSPDAASKAFKKFLRRHGLPEIRMHDLRHSSASLALSQGIALQEVSKRLGHSSIGITSDTYAHLYDERQRAAGEAMDRVLTNSSAKRSL